MIVEQPEKKASATQQFYKELDGASVYLITLQAGEINITVTNIGCAIIAIETPDKFGIQKNIVAGYQTPEAYLDNPDYLGCVLGRYANRITAGRFELSGKPVQLSLNDGENHLHGGVSGFQQKIWKIAALSQTTDEATILLEYMSRDGEEGYPGNLVVQVRYTLTGKGQLKMQYTYRADRATPVNLSNHSYFNLTGFEEAGVYDHVLQVHASRYTPTNADNTPTGQIEPVQHTPFDFMLPQKIGACMSELTSDRGYNHNFVLNKNEPEAMIPAAVLTEPITGRVVEIHTDRPGIQVYTANWWQGNITGIQGKVYEQHGAVALETQAFPDSLNHPHFSDTVVLPGKTYRTTTIYTFGVLS